MPMTEAEWLAIQTDPRRFPLYPYRAAAQETPLTDAQMLASTLPLARLLPSSEKSPAKRADGLRIMSIQLSGVVSAGVPVLAPGGIYDETNPTGRAMLLTEINRRCGVPNG